jgi:transforming growth factor-beta-induced protein
MKILSKLKMLTLGSGLAFASAQGQSTIFEIVENSDQHTILESALIQQGLDTTLNSPSNNFTLFAPTDSAFLAYLSNTGQTAEALLANPALTNILLHHVLGSEVFSEDLNNAEVSTLNGKDVTVNINNGVKVDSANVSSADLDATNGVVHAIDYVLLPTYDDVTEIVIGSSNHTTLLAALQKANLVGTLQDLAAEYTVFAPTDSAFNQYLTNAQLTAEDLLNSPDLADILLHHVLGVKAVSSSLSNSEVVTLNGRDVTVNTDSGVKIDSANVSAADLMADNGVVHVVDYVLLPTYDDVTEIVIGSSNHTTLLAALQKANLVGTLQDLSAEYTVFAPTDSAFNQYLGANGLSAEDLLNNPELSSILLHHVLGLKVPSSDLVNGEVTTLNNTVVMISVDAGVKVDSAHVTTADLMADNGVVHVLDAVLELTGSTGILETNKVMVAVYPNPVVAQLFITGLNNGQLLQVFTLSGQLVKQAVLSGNAIDVADLPAGQYILKTEASDPVTFLKQ